MEPKPFCEAALQATVRAALDRDGWRLGFAAPLEDRYNRERAAARARFLRAATAFGIALDITATLIINLVVVPAPDWVNVAIQLSFAGLAGAAIAAVAFREKTQARPMEWWAGASCAAFTLSVLVAVGFSPPEFAIENMFLVALPLVNSLFIVRLRFPQATLLAITAVAALTLEAMLRPDLPIAVRAYPPAFLLTIAIPSLYTVYAWERDTRRVWLHDLFKRLTIEDLASRNSQLAALSSTDPLTGAANRRRLDTILEELCDAGAPFALLLGDVDHFKNFNDRHGHIAGDTCLREVAAAMAAQLRAGDLLARFGGEEFAVVLPGLGDDAALGAADRVCLAVASHRFALDGALAGVTISIGAAVAGPGATPACVIQAADEALYAAKRAGRNCVMGTRLRRPRVVVPWPEGSAAD